MNEAQRNECSFERLVMRLMDEAGLCAYGEDTGSYNVPVPAMLSRIGRIVEAAMQLGRDECISEAERLRAEVEDYRTNGAAAVRFAPSSAYWSNELRRLFGDDARTGIEVLESRYRQELARADRLAGALRELRNHTSVNSDQIALIDAALEQEE